MHRAMDKNFKMHFMAITIGIVNEIIDAMHTENCHLHKSIEYLAL